MDLGTLCSGKYMNFVAREIWIQILVPCLLSRVTLSKLLDLFSAWLSHLLNGNKNIYFERFLQELNEVMYPTHWRSSINDI